MASASTIFLKLISILTFIACHNFKTVNTTEDECVKAHLLSEGTHHIQEPNCKVVIIVEENSNCIPILNCDYTESCGPENSLDISDGLGGRESFCESFKIHPSSNSDHLFINSRESPPECYVTCSVNKNEIDSRPLEITERRKFTDTCECGLKAPVSGQNTKIIGGEFTIPLEYPWMSSIIAPQWGAACGATIINDRTLISAAHCTFKPDKMDLWIKVHDWRETGKDELSEKLDVKNYILHPLWKRHTAWRFDISIYQLAKPINFLKDKGFSGTICLDHDKNRNWIDILSEIGEIIGRGFTTFENSSDTEVDYLKRGLVRIEETEYCDLCPSRSCQNVSTKFLCTNTHTGSACSGDSGGPMQIESSPGKWEQFGIASFGRCDLGTITYNKVSEHLPWIYHNSKDAIWCQE